MPVFFFSDIEGSTRLWEKHTDEMGDVIRRHDAILREQVAAFSGRVTKHTGDGITAGFEGGDPIACALETQNQFGTADWGVIGELRIRVGLHAGDAQLLSGDYFGPAVNCTARVMSAAWGGQIVLTPEVSAISPLPAHATLLDLGEQLFKGVSTPHRIFQLAHPRLPIQDFPPPRSMSGSAVSRAADEEGQRLASLDPPRIAVGLVSAILVPALQGDLPPSSGALDNNLGVLADLGAPFLQTFVGDFARRLDSGQLAALAPSGARAFPASLQATLESEMLAVWEAGGETATALRTDSSRLLQAVRGVEAAMEATDGDVGAALAHGLAELATGFAEFRWMLDGLQETLAEVRARQAYQLALQREQLDLQRQQLVKTNLILRFQHDRTALSHPPETTPLLEEAGTVPPADVPCPYKGLAAFEPEDTEYFFGREELIAELTAGLAGTRFLAVVGPSGSGKSSLVRAGLLPAIWQDALPSSQDWQTLVLTPGPHPLEELAVRISLLNGQSPASLLGDLETDHRALSLAVRRIMADRSEDVRLLLVADQFEEVFALCHDEVERRRFIDALVYGVEAETSRLVVIPTIRADFFGRCADYPNLAALLRDSLLIGPLGENELRQVVERPALVAGLQLEPGLVDTVVSDVAGEPGALPLLSHALLETWQRRRGSMLTLAGYAESGGVAGAIAQTADAVYGSLPAEQQSIARAIFMRLTELGVEGAQDTRRRVAPSELVRQPDEAPDVEAALATLAAARLITTGENTVEVAHEALIREWPALRGWLDDDREGLRTHRHLTDAALEWDRLGRDAGEMYRGARLATAIEWAPGHFGELNALEREFLQASQEAEERAEREREEARQRELAQAQKLAQSESQRAEEQARSAGRLKRRALMLAGTAAIAAILAGVALFARQQATRNATAAEAASDLAVAERNLAETAQALEAEQRATAQDEALARATAEAVAIDEREDARRQAAIGLASQAQLESIGPHPELGVLLALEAVENYPYTWQAEQALGHAVLRHRLVLELPHEACVNMAEVSPDGSRIATACDDTTAYIWDAVTGERQLALAGHEAWVMRADWSPSGDRILTSGSDRTTRVWDSQTGEEMFVLDEHQGPFSTWSPDGSRILSSHDADSTPAVWDGETGELLFTLAGHEGKVSTVFGWSHDGTRIATASRDGTAKIWDAATGEELLTLAGHEAGLRMAAFSPDGLGLATSCFDGSAKVWNASTGEEMLALPDHPGAPMLSWAPDGGYLLATTSDGIARAWDAETGELAFLLAGPSGPLQAEWSPDGSLIATGGLGGELLEIAFEPAGEDTFSGGVTGLSWSPSGDRFLISDNDGYARIHDATSGDELLAIAAHEGVVWLAAWSPDGDRVATASSDTTAAVWDSATGVRLLTLSGHAADVSGAYWSPSGDRILTVSADGAAKVWDVASGELYAICSPSPSPSL